MSRTTPTLNVPVGSNPRIAAIVVGGIVLVALLWVCWDIWNRHHTALTCGDGQRYAIDTRQFDTQYMAYSLKLEASISENRKVALDLDPVQQQQLSEALMSANEFRKYLVAGFDSCAVTKDQYARYGTRFQALDSLAHRIDELAAKINRSSSESSSLATLIAQYSGLASQLGQD